MVINKQQLSLGEKKMKRLPFAMHIFSFVLVLKEQRGHFGGFGFGINVFSFILLLYLS